MIQLWTIKTRQHIPLLLRVVSGSVHLSVTSDKGQCLVDLGQGKSGLTLSTVAATSLPRWMVGVAAGAYGWLRGAYGRLWGAYTCRRGTYAYRRGAYACRKGEYACIRDAYGKLWGA
jgi:hypothetical protein